MAEPAHPSRAMATPEIQVWRDPEGVAWYVIHCPACGTDLSTVCLGRLTTGPEGVIMQFFHPIRCPECRAPLVPALPPPGVIRATRLPNA